MSSKAKVVEKPIVEVEESEGFDIGDKKWSDPTAHQAVSRNAEVVEKQITGVEESEVLGIGKKKWSDTIALQAVSASYEILKVGGDLSPEDIMGMTVQKLLEMVTPNKLRLKLEKI